MCPRPEDVGAKRSSTPGQLSTSLRNVSCDPDYEIIDFSGHHTLNSTSGNQSHQKLQPEKNTMICALCGGQNLFASCKTCSQNFCEDCDSMNHKHPKRRGHIRQRIVNYNNQRLGPLSLPSLPPLPPKSDVQGQPPVPPPRRHRKSKQVNCDVLMNVPEEKFCTDARLRVSLKLPLDILKNVQRYIPTDHEFRVRNRICIWISWKISKDMQRYEEMFRYLKRKKKFVKKNI